MTLKPDRSIAILNSYLHTEKGSCYVKPFESYSFHKYESSSQGHSSRSNVINFQTLLAFIMGLGHIPTKLYRFPTDSFRDFVQSDKHTDVAKTDHAYFKVFPPF